jgi:hypothetical protein
VDNARSGSSAADPSALDDTLSPLFELLHLGLAAHHTLLKVSSAALVVAELSGQHLDRHLAKPPDPITTAADVT